jgi:hypothetical protein
MKHTHYYVIPLIEGCRVVRVIEVESVVIMSRHWEMVEMGTRCKTENVLWLGGGDVCTT